MPRIPEPEIERLKSEVSVERLVRASGIELKKSGKDWLSGLPASQPHQRLTWKPQRSPGGRCLESLSKQGRRQGDWV